MFEMHLISGRGANRSPAKPNVKTRPLPSLYIGIYYSFGFSRLMLFLGVFSGEFGFLYILFFNYFLSVSQWAPFS